MIVFSNSEPIEVNESEGQIVIEIDPTASEITQPTEVEISTIDGSALSTSFDDDGVGLDFSSIDNSVVTLDPNQPDSLTFTIDITDDQIAESEEDFQFEVTGVEDDELNGITSITIVDNEEIIAPELSVEELLPEISIDDVEQVEGDTDTTNFEFTVSLSQASELIVTVDFFTLDSTAETEARLDGLTLVDPADYIPLEGTLEFSPGETEKTIVVEALTDTEPFADEAPDETFLVNLDNATNADINQFIGRGIIVDDDLTPEIIDDDITPEISDELPFLQVDNQSFIEGDLDEDIEQSFTVNLVDSNGEAVTATEEVSFTFGTVDVTTAADLDYKFIANEVGTIAPGESSTSISITILGDEQTEIDETLFVVFSDLNPDLVQLRDGETELTTEITIINDDAISDSDFLDMEDPDDVTTEDSFGEGDLTENTVFRFFDSASGAYFYTASQTERDFVDDNLTNFVQEESSFASVDPDSSDQEIEIFRFFNSTTGGYLYTGDDNERDFIESNSPEFAFEGVAFAAFETEIDDSIPVYRFFETNAGVHFYTADEAEKTFIEDNLSNFDLEGIAFYALPLDSEL
ncbi:MAG: Calx-beta domain-containing protein [Cyanobacteria bacterium P01_A01_bin.83]